MVAKLPTVSNLVVDRDTKSINEARAYYDSLSDYVKTFVSKDDLAKLTTLEKKLKGEDDTQKQNTTSQTQTTGA
jgi:hypothetical protein